MCRKNLTGAECNEQEEEQLEIIPTVILLASNGLKSEYESDIIYSNLDEIAFWDSEYEFEVG